MVNSVTDATIRTVLTTVYLQLTATTTGIASQVGPVVHVRVIPGSLEADAISSNARLPTPLAPTATCVTRQPIHAFRNHQYRAV